MPSHEIRRLGLAQAPEGRGLFPSLSVFENIRLATRPCKSRTERREAMDRALDTYPVLSERRNQRAGTLSGGEQQMLSLALALATNVRLLVVDELSLGLAPLIVDRVFESIRKIKELGVTIIVIEQFVERALNLADDCLILQHGAVSWRGSTAEARADISALYLGHDATGEAPVAQA
jgi:branched-chain amino acid transport system ATP-binding protein